MRPNIMTGLKSAAAGCAALLAASLPGGCASAPTPDQFLSPSQLSDLVAGRTLAVQPGPDSPEGTLLYLRRDGTGWLTNELVAGAPPEPGQLSAVFGWEASSGSQVCFWATPTIGRMPSMSPPFRECVQVLRSKTTPGALTAVVTNEEMRRTGGLVLYQDDLFGAALIEQYLAQVRVLYGGHVPVWTAPSPAYAPVRS